MKKDPVITVVMPLPVILDDIDRPLDRDTMVTFCERLNYTYQLIQGDVKIFAFCTRNGY
jgi:hypothetical protein